MIHGLDDNVWAICIVAKADGRIFIQNIRAPLELSKLIVDALRPKPLQVVRGDSQRD